MANHKRERYVQEFEKMIDNLEYYEALKIVGILYHTCAPEAREKEVKVLFLMQNYSEVLRKFIKEVPNTQLEKDIYTASLVILEQYKLVKEYLEGDSKISRFCSAYIQVLLKQKDVSLDVDYKVKSETDDFFKLLYVKTVVNILVTAYEELKEANELSEFGVDTEDIVNCHKKMIKPFATTDLLIKDIYDEIEKDGIFNEQLIIAYMYRYIGQVSDENLSVMSFVNSFDTVDKVIFFLNVERRVSPKDSALDSITQYLPVLFEAVKKGNLLVGKYLKELYIENTKYQELNITEDKNVASLWRLLLSDNYYNLVEAAERTINENTIFDYLSPEGKMAYKAALWQYEMVMNDEYGVKDAGMLCLSYMRIIELELNYWFIRHLKKYSEEINNLFVSEKLRLYGQEKKDFKDKWSKCVSALLDTEKGFTLEKLWFLFILLSDNRNYKKNGAEDDTVNNSDCITCRIRELLEEVLSEDGKSIIHSGEIADMISYEKRNKFRNPPAHTKYVSKETAFECKTYVEEKITKIHSYLVKQD